MPIYDSYIMQIAFLPSIVVYYKQNNLHYQGLFTKPPPHQQGQLHHNHEHITVTLECLCVHIIACSVFSNMPGHSKVLRIYYYYYYS